jgi:hypothetical protein
MRACRRIAGLALILLSTFAVAQKPEFDWDWRNQEVIGREDPSVGNTSRLTESERSSLIDAIVLRLQKPMGDAGYDDDRIREIATTTRIRFIDVGAGQPLIFTTSIGLEGGCDALGNCPLWVFRHTDDGFLSLLNTIAASFTPEPTDAGFGVVFMHHLSAKESGLAMYRLADDKLQATGCYIALWPKPSNDPNQISDPKIERCKQPPLLESAHPVTPEASQPPAPDTAEPTTPAAAAPETQPGPDTAEPKEQAPSATEQPAQPKQDLSEQASPAAEAPKPDQPPSAPDQQTPQPAPKPDQAQPEQPSSSDRPSPDAKQENPKADQSQADQPAPEVKQDVAKPDQPQQQSPSDRATPDTNSTAPDSKQAEPPPQGAPSATPDPAPPPTSSPEPAPGPDSKQASPPSAPDQPQPNRAELDTAPAACWASFCTQAASSLLLGERSHLHYKLCKALIRESLVSPPDRLRVAGERSTALAVQGRFVLNVLAA